MVSANIWAMESCLILPQACAASPRGMVSVTTSSSIFEFMILSTAGPDRTGCTQYATTRLAPFSFKAPAAEQSVPAVSTISSTSTQHLFSTSPMMFITVATLARGRRLSMMARSASRRLAMARALTTPPTSGATTTMSCAACCCQMSASVRGEA